MQINSQKFIRECKVSTGIKLAQQRPYVKHHSDGLTVEYVGRGLAWMDECSLTSTLSFSTRLDTINYFELSVVKMISPR